MIARRKKNGLLYETELSWFILISALDVFMTYIILRSSAENRTSNVMYESNPVAQWILHRWGMPGMVFFKFGSVAVVCLIAEVVGRRRRHVGRLLLLFGTVVVGGVVIYSLNLFLKNRL